MTDDPVERFREWFQEAEQAGVEVPEAMTLATAGADGAPSARMVLLKGADDGGFVFYSGYVSRKAGELEREYEGREVPRPPHWGGFRLRPDAIEFWEHRENRLHDRICYTRAREGWHVERLAP